MTLDMLTEVRTVPEPLPADPALEGALAGVGAFVVLEVAAPVERLRARAARELPDRGRRETGI